ncbi:MAG: hypothetical protein N3B13_05875, partial [Deltaproteobacteria bacterium]|nr:hypothetical protein [Deltaproteobacteria bacterium]
LRISMYLKTKTAKCPECGAAVKMSNTNEISKCSHCQTPVLIRIDNYLPSYILKSNYKVKDTTSILLTKLKHYLIANDFIPKSRIISRTLYYVPFIYITGFRCGEHIIEENDHLTEEMKDDTKVIKSAFKTLIPAAKLSGWGTIGISAEQLINFREQIQSMGDKSDDEGIILKPDLSSVPEKELNLHFMTHNQKIKTEIITENCILVHYPIIRIVLKYRQNIYHYSIDGITGEIIYGIAPEAENNRFIPMAAAAFFSALFTGGILKFLISGFLGGIFLMPIYTLPLFGTFIFMLLSFIYIAWIFYRNYGEIVIERDKVEINKLNIPEETFIEKIIRPVFRIIEESVINIRKRNL